MNLFAQIGGAIAGIIDEIIKIFAPKAELGPPPLLDDEKPFVWSRFGGPGAPLEIGYKEPLVWSRFGGPGAPLEIGYKEPREELRAPAELAPARTLRAPEERAPSVLILEHLPPPRPAGWLQAVIAHGFQTMAHAIQWCAHRGRHHLRDSQGEDYTYQSRRALFLCPGDSSWPRPFYRPFSAVGGDKSLDPRALSTVFLNGLRVDQGSGKGPAKDMHWGFNFEDIDDIEPLAGKVEPQYDGYSLFYHNPRAENYFKVGQFIVWAAEAWRVHSKGPWPAPKWWRMHALAWGVGVATKARCEAKDIDRDELKPMGFNGTTETLLEYVKDITPRPGSVDESRIVLRQPRLLDWPNHGVMRAYMPRHDWPSWFHDVIKMKDQERQEKSPLNVAFKVMKNLQHALFVSMASAAGQVWTGPLVGIGLAAGEQLSVRGKISMDLVVQLAQIAVKEVSPDALRHITATPEQLAGLAQDSIDSIKARFHWEHFSDLMGNIRNFPDIDPSIDFSSVEQALAEIPL